MISINGFDASNLDPYISNVTFPLGEYGPTSLLEKVDTSMSFDAIDLEGIPTAPKRVVPIMGEPTQLSGVLDTKEVAPDLSTFEERILDTQSQQLEISKKAEADRIDAKNANMAFAAFRAVAGIGNAVAKYNQTVSQNEFNIQQARLQSSALVAKNRYEVLRIQSKGKIAGGNALLSAVSRGQSAQGDLAKTAVSNEEVYAAQNAMISEINNMREVFGIESKIRQVEYQNEIAKISRNKEIVDSLFTGAIALM